MALIINDIENEGNLDHLCVELRVKAQVLTAKLFKGNLYEFNHFIFKDLISC